MKVDVIIVGQGLCGTFLSWELQKAGISFCVIDNHDPAASSRAAAGIINPITGRRMVQTWMIETLIDYCQQAYRQLSNELQTQLFRELSIIDFFPTPQMRVSFTDRFDEGNKFLSIPSDANDFNDHFNYDFGYGEIKPCYLVDTRSLLSAGRKQLHKESALIEEDFDIEFLKIHNTRVFYKEIDADRIVFCDGISAASNPYFKNLPFAPNKGEALLIEANEIPSNHIFKKGMNIVPAGDQLFWVGSTYEWSFKDPYPTALFRENTIRFLNSFLKSGFRVVKHFAALRPATLERRPFVGFHPANPTIGILNGMGTKGCSLAPYFAKELTMAIKNEAAILPEASIDRFRKILVRTTENGDSIN